MSEKSRTPKEHTQFSAILTLIMSVGGLHIAVNIVSLFFGAIIGGRDFLNKYATIEPTEDDMRFWHIVNLSYARTVVIFIIGGIILLKILGYSIRDAWRQLLK